jgi:DNA-binding transcriptional regulator GbsR (MarR family)
MTQENSFLSPAMEHFVAYFGELGPRWGLQPDTCRIHALLYLTARPMSLDEICIVLSLQTDAGREALDDLLGWRMAHEAEQEKWYGSGEPWDLLFSAIEERRKREIPEAVAMLEKCEKEARADDITPAPVTQRISRLRELVDDIAAIDLQASRFSPRSLARLIGVGGKAARIMNRAFPAKGAHDDWN